MPDFQSMFMASKGKPIEYDGHIIHMADRLAIAKRQEVVISFDSVASDWRQGIHLSTKGSFVIDDHLIRLAVVLWHDTAPDEVSMIIKSADGYCTVKNVWDIGDGVMHSWHNGSAMRISGDKTSRRYECNDGRADDDFDDLVFTIALIK